MSIENQVCKLHTLLDKEFLYGLKIVSQILEQEGIKHALYGGVCLQAYFCDKFSEGRSIDTVQNLPEYLRPTNDFDFVLLSDKNATDVLSKLNDAKAEGNGYDAKFEIGTAGIPLLLVGKSGDETVIQLDMYTDNLILPQYVDKIKAISVVNEPITAKISVAPLEYTIAGKLAKFNYPQQDIRTDIRDLIKTLDTFDVDIETVGKILTKRSENEPHIKKTLPIIAETQKSGKARLVEYLKELKV